MDQEIKYDKKDNTAGFRRILLVFVIILGLILFLLAPHQTWSFLKGLMDPHGNASAQGTPDTTVREPASPITYSPPVPVEENFDIDGSVRPPGEYSHYHQYLTGKKNLDFVPTLRLCRSVLYRIQSDYVDQVETSQLIEGARKEVAKILDDGGFDKAPLKALPASKNFFKGVLQAYSDRIDRRIILYACIQGMVRGITDKYCRFLTPDDYKKFLERTHQSNYYGIGVRIIKDKVTDHVKVLEVFRDGPAKKAGLKKSDLITDINGKPIKGLALSKVSTRIKGPENTLVTISILRGKKTLSLKIPRRRIVVHSVHRKMLAGKVGYVKIDSFKEELDDEFRRAYSNLENQGLRALVVDMRNNPGGLVRAAQYLCGSFLPRGSLIATFRHRGNKERQIRVRGRQIVFVPVVVLVNEHTASSSEITSGALKDHGVAIIIGTRTRGKGSVQRTWRLSEGSGIKLTIEKIYTPKGFSINKNGIIPDVEAGSPPGFNFDGKDPQLKKALNYLKSKGIR